MKVETSEEKYKAFKESVVIPDPSRVSIKPNMIQELVDLQSLKNLLQFKLQAERAKEQKLKTIRQYPLTQQDAF